MAETRACRGEKNCPVAFEGIMPEAVCPRKQMAKVEAKKKKVVSRLPGMTRGCYGVPAEKYSLFLFTVAHFTIILFLGCKGLCAVMTFSAKLAGIYVRHFHGCRTLFHLENL